MSEETKSLAQQLDELILSDPRELAVGISNDPDGTWNLEVIGPKGQLFEFEAFTLEDALSRGIYKLKQCGLAATEALQALNAMVSGKGFSASLNYKGKWACHIWLYGYNADVVGEADDPLEAIEKAKTNYLGWDRHVRPTLEIQRMPIGQLYGILKSDELKEELVAFVEKAIMANEEDPNLKTLEALAAMDKSDT